MTEFGYFLSSEELSPQELVTTAQLAEQAGFDRIWISDHYHPWTREQGESAFVWSVIGAIAATTELKITTAVTCPTDRIHPAVLAQATATVASLAPGRFSFGVGSGERLNEHILGGLWGGIKICWAESADDAAKTAYRLWGFEAVGGQSAQDLPSWLEFEQLGDATSPDQIAETVPCGPDPDRAASAIKEYVDAGFDEVYVSQMGPDQDGGIRFLSEQVLPQLRGGRS
ncbi:MAG TPA: LLM class flavin-dependent oxidoreductase [Mycobacteriales bacterium]|nr:LLM class flavin-dependent oxidoreductase [Mycobacteriales bacterium]